MHVIVIGATGRTGAALTLELIQNPKIQRIDVLVRKALGIQHSKLNEHIVDFSQISAWDYSFIDKADIAFCTLGTTIKKAGSKERFFEIDYQYVLDFATLCKQKQVKCFSLVSSKGANSKSNFLYFRTKGELERSILALGFDKTVILRPGSLIRPKSQRLGEKVIVSVLKVFNTLNLFTKAKPVKVEQVAICLIQESMTLNKGLSIVENIQIHNNTIKQGCKGN